MKSNTYKGVHMTIMHTSSYGRYQVTDSENGLSFFTTDSELYDHFEDEEWAPISAWESLREKAREKGIIEQDRMSNEALPYGEVASISSMLEKLAEDYVLVEEFRGNGLI